MIKKMLSLVVAVFCVSAFLPVGASHAAAREDAIALVQKASAYYKTNGVEKAIGELSKKGGEFDKGELYVFAYDQEGTMVAHPNAALVGQNLIDTPDAKGKKFRREIIDVAKKDGKGWVSYVYLNKKTKAEEEKDTYFETSGDLVLACGIYKK